ncbi:MAG: rhomboid family intramembrane serine protease [Chloroflexi bacterium]|nr:rhomboid family intramembrane serine protease [Chloroflexota bacterium]
MIPIGDDPGPRHLTPFVTFALLAANVAAFVYTISLGERGIETLYRSAGVVPLEFARNQDIPPVAPGGSYYTTLLTSMFLHGGFLHIASNMLFLWIYGDNVEDRLGHVRYLIFYLLCGLAASATHIFFNWGSQIPSIGASGAIAGVLAGYIVMFPAARIRTLLFIGPFITITRVPALLLIGFWFVTQVFSGIASLGPSEQTTGVAFWAHVGGFVAGLPLVLLFRQPRSSYDLAFRQ